MGLNDDHLSSAEHDALRSRLLAGAKSIKPVGRHRRAIVTTTVSVALVAVLSVGAIGAANFLRMGDSSEPVATPTPTSTSTATRPPTPTVARTPSATPTSTHPPAAAVVPFDGDCERVMPLADVAAMLGTTAVMTSASGLGGVEPSLNESAALIGGLSCYWYTDDSSGWAGLTLYPLSVVPTDVVTSTGSFDCADSSTCARAEVFEDVWVHAATNRLWAAEQPLENQERVVLDQRLSAMLSSVGSRNPIAVVGTLTDDAWLVPPCADLADTVTGAADIAGASMGFPGDSLASGAAWEVLVANRVVDWCSWYDGASETIVELVIQPELGMPGEAELTAIGAAPAEVTGADAAFLVPNPRVQTNSRVIAVRGVNRVTVSGQSDARPEVLAAVAAAVLLDLDRR